MDLVEVADEEKAAEALPKKRFTPTSCLHSLLSLIVVILIVVVLLIMIGLYVYGKFAPSLDHLWGVCAHHPKQNC